VCLGDLITADKYAGNIALLIANWFVDKIDELNLVTALQSQFHSARDEGFAGGIDLVQQLEVSLSG